MGMQFLCSWPVRALISESVALNPPPGCQQDDIGVNEGRGTAWQGEEGRLLGNIEA